MNRPSQLVLVLPWWWFNLLAWARGLQRSWLMNTRRILTHPEVDIRNKPINAQIISAPAAATSARRATSSMSRVGGACDPLPPHAENHPIRRPACDAAAFAARWIGGSNATVASISASSKVNAARRNCRPYEDPDPHTHHTG